MGDQGKLYVNEDVVPVYKKLLREADLIVPNQFEVESVLRGIRKPVSRLTEFTSESFQESRSHHFQL